MEGGSPSDVSRVDDTVITITITVINNRRFAVVLQCS